MHRYAPCRASASVGRRSRVRLEWLESRRLLSTASVATTITPLIAQAITPDRWHGGGGGWFGGGGGLGGGGITNPTPLSGSMTPAELSAAYGFALSADTGAGQTIAIVDAYNDPNIQADLAKFSAQYNLPTPDLTVLNQNGQKTNLPQSDPSWSLEIALDVEWAHAVAPGAKLVLVEADSTSVSDLMKAVQTAASRANVVSMSWGGSEFLGEQQYDSAAYFGNPNVTFVAASGDDGGVSGAEWPAVSPHVVSVGGTTLSLSSAGGYGAETAWNATASWFAGGSGSAGGVSLLEALPGFQANTLGSRYASGRVTPDVASNANPSTGLAVYNSVPGGGATGWTIVGGTSAGAPVWSAIIASANQARAANHLGALSSTQTLNFLYGLYGSSTAYAANFHDITSGANFVAYATRGYDLVTGLGTPIVSKLIAAASTFGSVATSATHSTATASSTTSTTTSSSSSTKPKPSAVVISVTITPTLLNPSAGQSSASLGSLATVTPLPLPTSLTPSFGQTILPVSRLSAPQATLAFRPNQPYVNPITIVPFEDPAPAELPTVPGKPGLFDDPIIQPDLKFEMPLLAAPIGPQVPVWDSALGAVLAEPPILWNEVSIPTPPAIEATPTTPALGSAVVAGAVIALWSTWERRPTLTATERRRWTLPLDDLQSR